MIEIVAEALVLQGIEQAGGVAGAWASVSDVRKASGLDVADFNAAALRLAIKQTVVFVPEDNQKTLSEQDWSDAVIIGGCPCHLVTIG